MHNENTLAGYVNILGICNHILTIGKNISYAYLLKVHKRENYVGPD
jgi:hypothetical protein